MLTPLFTSLLSMDMKSEQVEFVLADNGSTDGSVNYVRKEFPSVRIFPLGRNEGFAPALNKAVEAYDSTWICFLNNDVRVHPDWLSNLLHAARKIEAPCFTSHLLDWQGKHTQFAGGWINLFGKGFEDTKVKSDRPYEIFFPCGCGMMIRRDVFRNVGGFDDDYFMIYEDVDLGWRMRLFGFPVYFVPDAFVLHRGHASLDRMPYTQKAIYYERNSLATLYKNLADDSLSVVLPLALREALMRAKGIGGIGVPVRYSPDGVAVMDGVSEFLCQLPMWKKKRETVQSYRHVGDEEIFRNFFPDPAKVWAFSDTHYQKISHPAVQSIIEGTFQRACKALALS